MNLILQRLDYLQNRLEWLGGYDYEQKTKRIIYGLGFTDEDLDKPASAFLVVKRLELI